MKITSINNRRMSFPLFALDLPNVLSLSDNSWQDDFGSYQLCTVGRTPFVIHSGKFDPQDVIRHAIAAIQICHENLWLHPEYRDAEYLEFSIPKTGRYRVKPRHAHEAVEVFAQQNGVMVIELPAPDCWREFGLDWLLRAPTFYQTTELGGYMADNPMTQIDDFITICGGYPSWNKALTRANLTFE